MTEYRVGIYIRLSLADEDTGSGKAESDSVTNQRSLINRFLDCHSELSQCQRSEFCDDGFTGTNMDRPAFAEMMQRVKVGEFNLVCVKDFSRFSRDYIEIGDCLECLFPFLRIRFISINDHYDSADFVGTTGGIDVSDAQYRIRRIQQGFIHENHLSENSAYEAGGVYGRLCSLRLRVPSDTAE